MNTFFQGKIPTIPNLLSTLRILLIPIIMWSYLSLEDNTTTVILLAVSGLLVIVCSWEVLSSYGWFGVATQSYHIEAWTSLLIGSYHFTSYSRKRNK